jgi:2-C-methyl-D-erythritol 4-phosphate cytidylyltransferase
LDATTNNFEYQILIAFNKLKIMSEVVLLVANTDRLQQVEDYVSGCTTSRWSVFAGGKTASHIIFSLLKSVSI